MTIRRKLIGLGIFIVLLCAALSAAGFWGITRLGGTINLVSTDTAAVRTHMEADMMHDALRADVYAAVLAGEKASAEKKKEIANDLAEHIKKFRAAIEENGAHVSAPEVHKAIQEIEKPLAAYIDKARGVAELASTDQAAALAQLEDFTNKFRDLEAPMEKIGDMLENGAKTAQSESARTAVVSKWVMAGTAIVFILCAGGFLLAITRAITKPLVQAVSVFKNIADGEGDLTQRLEVHGQDEIAELSKWFNKFLDQLHDIISQVKGSVTEVAEAAHQLSSASDQLSSGAQEQASSLEETAASLEEITGTVKQTADNSRQASQLAVGARDTADQGGAVVNNAVEAVGEINKSSKKIADIITTIDEIAFQTNLLALNAAVEAARAGEQGRGFAVVASEVRNLAQRSATAAKEIKTLIQDSVQKVEVGSEMVTKSGRTLEEIVGSVKRVSDIIGEIAAASAEQSSGIDQINKAVSQMDQVTQSNAAQTEELSSTAQTLTAQAGNLQSLVGRFKLSDRAVAFQATASVAAGVPQGITAVTPHRAKTKANGKAKRVIELTVPAHGSRQANTAASQVEAGFEEF